MILRTLSSVVLRALGASSVFLMNLVVARFYDVESAAVFFVMFSLSFVLSQVFCCGIEFLNVRALATLRAGGSECLIHSRHSFFAVLFIVILASVSIYIASSPLSRVLGVGDAVHFKWAASVIFFMTLTRLLSFNLQAFERPFSSVVALSIIAPSIVVVSVLFSDGAVDGFILLAIGAFVAFLFAFLFSCGQFWGAGSCDFRFEKIREILYSASPFWISSSLSLVMQNFGIFVAGGCCSAADVAGYSSAQRTANLVSLILMGVNIIVAPKFAKFSSCKNEKELRGVVRFATRFSIFFAFPMLLIFSVFSRPIMGLFGDEYSAYGYLLFILSVGQFVNVASGSVGYLLNMTGRQNVLRNIIMIVAPVSFLASYLAGSLYGVMGVAVISAASIGIYNLAAVVAVRRSLGFWTLNIF